MLAKVLVMDHLGRNIPVPTMFCSTWKDFDYIINCYCRDRLGHRFVERGDYRMRRPEDSRMIAPSEFSRMVEPEMVLEMSIIIWRNVPDANMSIRMLLQSADGLNVASARDNVK